MDYKHLVEIVENALDESGHRFTTPKWKLGILFLFQDTDNT
jgi:hypothetical protein